MIIRFGPESGSRCIRAIGLPVPGMTVAAAVFLKTVIRRDVLAPGMRNDSKEQIHHDRNSIGGGGGLHKSLPVIRFTAKEGGERWS